MVSKAKVEIKKGKLTQGFRLQSICHYCPTCIILDRQTNMLLCSSNKIPALMELPETNISLAEVTL